MSPVPRPDVICWAHAKPVRHPNVSTHAYVRSACFQNVVSQIAQSCTVSSFKYSCIRKSFDIANIYTPRGLQPTNQLHVVPTYPSVKGLTYLSHIFRKRGSFLSDLMLQDIILDSIQEQFYSIILFLVSKLYCVLLK